MTLDRKAVAARLARLDPAQRAALAAKMASARTGPPLRARSGPRERFPLGMDQERLWILDQLDPGSITYTLGFGLRFHGEFDLAAFTEAAHAVVRRHELLRCGVETEDGTPYLRVHPDRTADITFADLADGPSAEREDRRAAFIERQVQRPFDLSADPVLRLGIADLGGGDYQVVETMPHSFTDQWSYVRLNRELLEHYRAIKENTTPHVPDLPVQFGDFAQWQREYFAGPRGAEHRTFWREYLADVPGRLPLPYDGTPNSSDHAGRQYNFILDQDVAAAFLAKAREARTTSATAMVAAYVALLHEETGERDIVVGVPSVTRGQAVTEDLVGFLLTNVPIRVRLPRNPTPDQVLAATIEASTAVAEHREVPFSEIVEAAAPDRTSTRYPLLQTMLVQLTLDDTVFFTVPGADIYANAVPEGISSMDLTVAWWQVGEVVYGRIEYRTAVFRDATIERMAGRLLQLVARFVDAPGTPLRVRRVRGGDAPQSVFAPAVHTSSSAPGDLGKVAEVWRAVLGLPRADAGDVFFEVGGTSLLAVRLAHQLRAAGFTVTLKDVFTHPTLGQLAEALLSRTGTVPAARTPEPVGPLGPEQELLFEAGLEKVELWAHSYVLDATEPLEAERLRAAVDAVLAAHPTLSTIFTTTGTARTAHPGNRYRWRLEEPDAAPHEVAAAQRAELDAATGLQFAVSLIPDGPGRLVLSASHLVIDGLSWGVVISDLARAYRGLPLEAERTGYLEYAAALRRIDPAPQAAYWRAQLAAVRPLSWTSGRPNLHGSEVHFEVTVPCGTRRRSLEAESVTAVARALRPYSPDVVLSVMGLGREPLPALPDFDPGRAVGYYSSAYPLHVPLTGGGPLDDLAAVDEALRAVPDGGKPFALLLCSADAELRAEFAALALPRVVVNYVGTLTDPGEGSAGLFAVSGEIAAQGNELTESQVDVDVAVGIRGDQVVMRWLYSPDTVPEHAVREAAAQAARDLDALLRPAPAETVPGRLGVTEQGMDELFARLGQTRGGSK
ncbi:condensation domain-containing protein [Streptomyces chattanoogensis]|uniref:Carrier domain-containing protein n=1 Tax=Streptomyces chattanoogensis TaxID=66876 RepID=A0A0N1JWR2_9ACTN|nr:condensation domain-containing protein [Streptomyces chattanoogensis]KPC60635.1 hypothetical protein ADL29_28360 [Streptomyces chattanoogensis]